MAGFTRGAMHRPYATDEGLDLIVDPANRAPDNELDRWAGPGLMLPAARNAVDPTDPSTWNGPRVFPGVGL